MPKTEKCEHDWNPIAFFDSPDEQCFLVLSCPECEARKVLISNYFDSENEDA